MSFILFAFLLFGSNEFGNYNAALAREIRLTDQDLLSSFNNARPGDFIRLNPDTTYYLQNVELFQNGSPHAAITLAGDKGTKITSEGVGLHVRGSYWRIQNIAFENLRTGIVVSGNNNTFRSLTFHGIEDEGIELIGQGNLIKSCVFNGVSHGIVISGKENTLLKNSVTSSTSTVTASANSCCGRLDGNVFNGVVNIFGGDYTVLKNIANSDVAIAGRGNNFKGNVINGRLDVSGCGNSFFGNTAGSSDFTGTCYNWDDGSNHFGTHIGNIHNDYKPNHNIHSNVNHIGNKPNNHANVNNHQNHGQHIIANS